MKIFLIIFLTGLIVDINSASYTTICTNQQNGAQLPNSEDCSTFYVCEYDIPTLIQCPGGLLYDPLILVCNWPENVICGETPIVETTTTEIITETTTIEIVTEPIIETTTEVVTETTTELVTEPTTEDTTELVTEPTTEATTELVTEPTTEVTTELVTEPTTEATTELVTELTTETTTELITEPTTEATTELITEPTTETTTELITEPTTEATTELITEPTTEATTEVVTEPTTEATTTTQATTELITEPTTEATTEVVTEPTTEATTELITEPTPEATTEIVTEPTTEATTTTQATTELVTDPTTEATTEIVTETTTEAITQPTTESTTELTTEPNEELTESPIEPPKPICQNGDTYFPHTEDNTKYYICVSGISILMKCPENYFWNETINKCITTAGEISTEIPAIPKPICDESHVYFAYELDFHKYYICIGGSPLLMTCPNDYVWNQETKKCEEIPKEKPSCSGGENFFEYKPDATKYYICSGGMAILMSCPANYHWDNTLFKCKLVEPNDGDLLENYKPDCTTGQVYFPDITNETKYYICTGGKALLMTCPLGYKWDTDISKCALLD